MQADAFVARWTAREGGAERANYQMFLAELCDVVGVGRPDVAQASAALNDYAFERAVRPRETGGAAAPKRIDLYKRGCFILEAKQSRLKGAAKALGVAEAQDEAPLGRRSPARGWDVMMQNARRQAENYVFLLDADHPAPPFLVVCDVGHCFELYADFTGTGRAYRHFPDRQGFRIYVDELREPETRAKLAMLWTDPLSLDPAREAARVTRGIAKRLAEVSKTLEKSHPAEEVAHFLMRCIFTMFADDVGLLPENSFKELLKACLAAPENFARLVDELWSKMDEPSADRRFSAAIRAQVPYFNGNLFRGARAFPLGADEIGELIAAAEADWREVDPAIFGALLEQALDPKERRRLGAHYTPRAYVQRLVDVTVMEPLRADWQAALTRAEAAAQAKDGRRAVAAVREFHRTLCRTRVLDPACGTGNFLYVALELMKALEGEVLETLARLGEPESMGLDGETVGPHQFLGLELNTRAAAIAELVVWIGYLQQHYRTRSGHPGEPILRAFKNVNFGRGGGYDAVLTWEGFPEVAEVEGDGGTVKSHPTARRPVWPEAESVVGNPPFIGNKRMRDQLGDSYVEALRKAHPDVPASVDLAMYWWNAAAEKLTDERSNLKRFGLVTTNSITQTFNRRVISKWLLGPSPVSVRLAVADHPWMRADGSSAAVRIAMSVMQRGRLPGELLEVASENMSDPDSPKLNYRQFEGDIAADLTLGAGSSENRELLATSNLAHQGVTPLGEGFRLSRRELEKLGYDIDRLPTVVRRYLIGRDLVQRPQERFIIDLFGLSESEARKDHPKLFDIVLDRVRPDRAGKKRATYRDKYWIYAEPRSRMRDALKNLPRFIATCRTAKHRVFVFMPAEFIADAKIVVVATDQADIFATLSSRPHVLWSERTGAWLGVGNDSNYNHSDCFSAFSFPDPSPDLRRRLASAGEELDALRKAVMAEHPDLTITGLYNVLAKLRAGAALSAKDEDVKRRGLVLVLKDLHDTIDRLVHEAYGWPATLSDDEILERLVALNAERAREEAAGHVRWLRPDYQAPRFGAARRGAEKAGRRPETPAPAAAASRPAFPRDPYEHPLAVEAALAAAGRPLGTDDLVRAFGGGARGRRERVDQALATLALYGRVAALPDGRFAALRAM